MYYYDKYYFDCNINIAVNIHKLIKVINYYKDNDIKLYMSERSGISKSIIIAKESCSLNTYLYYHQYYCIYGKMIKVDNTNIINTLNHILDRLKEYNDNDIKIDSEIRQLLCSNCDVNDMSGIISRD